MRTLIFAAISGAALSMGSLAAMADDQLMQPAGYDPSRQLLCVYPSHEGVLIHRPICQSAEAWATQKEHARQVFRDYLRRSLTMRR